METQLHTNILLHINEKFGKSNWIFQKQKKGRWCLDTCQKYYYTNTIDTVVIYVLNNNIIEYASTTLKKCFVFTENDRIKWQKFCDDFLLTNITYKETTLVCQNNNDIYTLYSNGYVRTSLSGIFCQKVFRYRFNRVLNEMVLCDNTMNIKLYTNFEDSLACLKRRLLYKSGLRKINRFLHLSIPEIAQYLVKNDPDLLRNPKTKFLRIHCNNTILEEIDSGIYAKVVF